MGRLIKTCVLIITLLVSSNVFAATYYIDFNTGSDMNAGMMKTSPWKRAPGMNGFTGSYVHQAGDHFVFKGGVVWPATAMSLRISKGGSVGNPDYYGTDESWFEGSAFKKPVFDGEQISSSSLVQVTAGHIILDNLEIKGLLITSGAFGLGTIYLENAPDVVMDRLHVHGWDLKKVNIVSIQRIGQYAYATTAAPHGFVSGQAIIVAEVSDDHFNGAGNADALGKNAEVDPAGLDATHFRYANPGQDTTIINDGGWASGVIPGASGGIIGNYGAPTPDVTVQNSLIENENGPMSGMATRMIYNVHHNVIHDVATAIMYVNTVNDNEIYNIDYPKPSIDPDSHTNLIYFSWIGEHAPEPDGSQGFVYNNWIHDVNPAEGIYILPGFGGGQGIHTHYVYNNVIHSRGIHHISTNNEGLPANGLTAKVYIWNNTLVQTGNQSCLRTTTHGSFGNITSLTIQNNQCITDQATPWEDNGGYDTLVYDHQLVQSSAQAAAAGYTLANHFSPITGSSGTVGAGVNAPAGIFAEDIKAMVRPQAGPWDIGAYQWEQPADYYDWNVRTDRHGKAAGYFETTPFPIDENTTRYAVKSDAHPQGIIYELGKKYYVDGGYAGGDGDGSWARPWASIAAAVAQVPSGNATIIVRGAHGDFDGIYKGTTIKSGVDNTHRFMIVGYGQERPVIDADSASVQNAYPAIWAAGAVHYATVQRIKAVNSYVTGIRTGPDDGFLNMIDIWLFNNDRYDFSTKSINGDGNLYFLSSDNNWIFHATSEHTYGHCYKIGDGASDNTIEWSVARECGYWDGFPLTTFYGAHPAGIDVPSGYPDDSDGDGMADRGWNNVVRYNIVHTVMMQGVQLRRTPNFSFHHNEVYDANKYEYFTDFKSDTSNRHQVEVLEYDTYGDFYDNIIRDPGSPNTNNLRISTWNQNNENLNIFNNLIYNSTKGEFVVDDYNERNTVINFFSNTLMGKADNSMVYIKQGRFVYDAILNDNIFVETGTGTAMDTYGLCDSCTWQPQHSHNLYYAPKGKVFVGSRFKLDALTEIVADPQWINPPAGTYHFGMGALKPTSPAIDQGKVMRSAALDFLGQSRGTGALWDIGALQYSPLQAAGTGDISGDGRVTMYDAALVLKYTVGGQLTADQQVQADINGDATIDAGDAAMIARRALGLN